MNVIVSPKSTLAPAVPMPIWDYVFLLAICLPLLLIRLDTYPATWLDEGYATHAARVLAEQGIYGTYTTDGYLPFDPGLSIGPTIVIPAALSFRWFGAGLVQGRLIGVLFAVAAVLGMYQLTTSLYGRKIALLAILMAVGFPTIENMGFLPLGRQVLGEPIALATLTIGLLLWFRSCQAPHWPCILLSGLALGLSVVSKFQLGIVLFPSLLLIALLRTYVNRSQWKQSFIPVGMAVLIAGIWFVIQRVGTPEAMRTTYSDILAQGLKTHFLTDLSGQNLTRGSWGIVVLMTVVAALSSWHMFRRLRYTFRTITLHDWKELTLITIIFCFVAWFVVFSIGWPRYTYVPLALSLILLGRWVGNSLQFIQTRLQPLYPTLTRRLYGITFAGLTITAIGVNVYPLAQATDTQTQKVANYIDTHISGDGVIESWEWQLDALTDHWAFHHPDSLVLFLAIQQYSHDQLPLNLDYDLLQANPDYLITGPFSDWTGIYRPQAISASFELVTEIGSYRIYKRIRE